MDYKDNDVNTPDEIDSAPAAEGVDVVECKDVDTAFDPTTDDGKDEATVGSATNRPVKCHIDLTNEWCVFAIVLAILAILAPLVTYVTIMSRMPSDRPDLEKNTPTVSGAPSVQPSHVPDDALSTESSSSVPGDTVQSPGIEDVEDPDNGEVVVAAPTLETINFKRPSYSEGVTGWEVTLSTEDTSIFEVYHDLAGAETKEGFAPEFEEYSSALKEYLKSEGTFENFEDFKDADGYLAFQGSNTESTQRYLMYCQISGSQQVTISQYLSGDVAEFDEASRLIMDFLGADVDAGILEKMQLQAESSVKQGGTYSVLLMDAERGVNVQVAVQDFAGEMETWVVSASRVLKGPIKVDDQK